MTAAPIEIVIPARNAASTLDLCLRGALQAGFAPSEIVVADDGSDDGTRDLARRFGVRVARTPGAAGAGAARNAGIACTTSPLVLFVDADVTLHPGTRRRVLEFFADHPEHAGLIGSYDAAPPAPGRLSQIRNLLHHHVHQTSGGDVPSFWTGCGAVRRSDFDAVGGFEPGHKLEDVALGMALTRAGRKVRLDPAMLCTHLKAWTLRSMIRADLVYRALPWSRMLLDPRNVDIEAALNAGPAGKGSVILSGLAVLAVAVAPALPVAALVAGLGAVAGLAALNAVFLRLIAGRMGGPAALQAVGVLWVHFLCAGAGFGIAFLERLAARATGSRRDRGA